MTESDRGWVWPALERMADLATKKAEAEQLVERLANAYREERDRVLANVPDWSEQEIETTVNAIHLIGLPSGTAERGEPGDQPSGDPLAIPEFLKRQNGGDESGAPAAASASPTPDPLAIPTDLRRGEGSSQEDNPPGPTQAHEVA